MSPSATLETSGTTLEPGSPASVPLTVRNDRDVVDEYRFRMVGPLAPWTAVEPEKVSVYPGDSATVTVLFRPPRSWDVPAGNIPYGVQVLPAQHPQDSVVAEGVLDVQPFWETSAELVPRTSEGRGGGRHRVAVDNRGNIPVTVQLVPKDPENRLHMVLGAPALTVQPGTVQSADLRVRPRHRIWRGTQTAHPFTVELRPDGGPGTMLTGTHRQDPVLPGWSPKLLKYLVVLLLIGALIGALIWAVVEGVQRVKDAVPRVFAYVQECAVAIPEGNGSAVCLGVGGPTDGSGGGGGSSEPEVTTEELQVEVDAGVSAVDALSPPEGDVFTTTEVVLSSSGEGFGTFRLLREDGLVIRQGTVQGFAGQTFTFPDRVSVTSDQRLFLEVVCSLVDEQLFPSGEECSVTAEVTGELVSSGE